MDAAPAFAYLTHSLGALSCVMVAVWIARSGNEQRSDRWAGVIALVLTANWCVAAASLPPGQPVVAVTQITANLAWLFVLFRLFANDGRDESMRIVRPMIAALVGVESLQGILLLVSWSYADNGAVLGLVAETSSLLRMMVSIGALVLLHNLYVGAAHSSRHMLRWNTAALAGLWAFTLNFNTIAYLAVAVPTELTTLRGVAVALVAVPFGLGYTQKGAGLRFQPSRAVAFRSLSLLIIGAYLAMMLALATWLNVLDGSRARWTHVGLVVAAGALALIWLPSQRLRGWLRVTAVKHLFKHRYDYRAEWLRFTQTIGRSAPAGDSLHQRAVKALADITDSPSGVLLLRDEGERLVPAAHWHWPQCPAAACSLDCSLLQRMERDGYIVDLDDARGDTGQSGEFAQLPAWLFQDHRAWAAVPLLHFNRMVGVVVLARPAIPRNLDWEDFDLLGLAGQQLASYLSEQAGQEALSEAARFDEFNRRMAFVMHDIKNLSSQLSLLLSNAERHVDKPEFRQDMLVTLRNSSDKLTTLLARLGHYGKQAAEVSQPFDLSRSIADLVDRFAREHRVIMVPGEPLNVVGRPEAFEQAVAHIVQNAIEASDTDGTVMVEVFSNGLSGVVQIVDSGRGMDAAFLRNGLFKPFVSTKDNGFGIGAYEARELVRAMGGRLEVESREGLGSRFTLSLPLKAADDIYEATRQRARKDAA